MKLELITPPETLPISIESVKSYLKVLDDKQDEQIELLIRAMITKAEDITNCQLGGIATFALFLEDWKNIKLLKSPLIEVERIEYRDESETTLILDNSLYFVDDKAIPATISILKTPQLSSFPNPITIFFRAGYETLPVEVELWTKVKVLEEFYALPTIERNRYIDRMLDSLRIIPI